MKYSKVIILFALFSSIFFILCTKETPIVQNEIIEAKPSKLAVVWTSGDKEVAIKMVFMYTNASKNNAWWDEVRLIVWGPSSKLLSEDVELQEYVKKMKESGVELFACIVCADMYGVTEKLRDLGIEVKGMGAPLTSMVKDGWELMTF